MDILVRPAVPRDIVYIDALQWKNAEMLAFFPRCVFEDELHQVILAEVNGEPAGYVYRGAYKGILKIHQACIEYDLRGRLYGAAMMRQVIYRAAIHGVMSIVLRCAADLEANDFWQAMGFFCFGHHPGGLARGRIINCWRLDLAPQLFAIPEVEPIRQAIDRSAYVRPSADVLRISRFSQGHISLLLRRNRMRGVES